MTQLPVAVLKCTWSDVAWSGDAPASPRWSGDVVARVLAPSPHWWGVARFWEDTSFGRVDLAGTIVFPWLRLPTLAAPTGGTLYSAQGVFQAAVAQAVDVEEWNLAPFSRVVVFVDSVAPQQPSSAGHTFTRNNRTWKGAVVYPDYPHDFITHEYGHALGFEHCWGPGVSFFSSGAVVYTDVQPYADPYCVMAAQSYGGANPTFAIAADPAGPPAGDPFWRSLPPMPSAAVLDANVSSPNDPSPLSVDLGAFGPGSRRRVRLRARDLVDGPAPIAVRTRSSTVVNRRQGYWVELRRGQPGTYERGIGVAPNSAAAGLVIHSEQVLDEYPDPGNDNDVDLLPKVVYDGRLPLPNASGNDSYVSVQGDLTVRIEDVAADLSWVELIVGGADLQRESTIRATFAEMSRLVTHSGPEQVAHDVPVFACGTGTFSYSRQDRDTTLVSTAFAGGFRTPVFTWALNGVTVPAGPSTVTVPVTAGFPEPLNEPTRAVDARFRCRAAGNTLYVDTRHEDGNHDLSITVTATEGDGSANPAPAATVAGRATVEGVRLAWEPRYYEALTKCINRVRELNRRFAKSVRWSRLDIHDPRHVINALRDLVDPVTHERPELADGLRTVLAEFEARV